MLKKIILEECSDEQKAICKKFAIESCGTSKDEYARRNQNDMSKIQRDIYFGKLAEYMVYNNLIERGYIVNEPDVAIYIGYRKSYDADLTATTNAGKIELHVKCHVKNSNFPVSWMFQKNDPLLSKRPINNYLCLVVIEDGEAYMYVCDIRSVSFGEPKKMSLRKSKACLYLEGLA